MEAAASTGRKGPDCSAGEEVFGNECDISVGLCPVARMGVNMQVLKTPPYFRQNTCSNSYIPESLVDLWVSASDIEKASTPDQLCAIIAN